LIEALSGTGAFAAFLFVLERLRVRDMVGVSLLAAAGVVLAGLAAYANWRGMRQRLERKLCEERAAWEAKWNAMTLEEKMAVGDRLPDEQMRHMSPEELDRLADHVEDFEKRMRALSDRTLKQIERDEPHDKIVGDLRRDLQQLGRSGRS